MSKAEFGEIQTVNSQMKSLLQVGKNVATSRASVLIEGPSGCGKKLLAQFIHQQSHRRDKKYVVVNCASSSMEQLENELFGSGNSSFHSSSVSRQGRIEKAQDGTLLLEEVHAMPVNLQAKLLKVLQDSAMERFSSGERPPLNVRVIATAKQDLRQLVDRGLFREDLYYRLNVIRLQIPALRERTDDIELLARFFTRVSSLVNDRPGKTLSPESMGRLIAWNWPGNVRELENTIERAVLLSSSSVITPEELGLPIHFPREATTDKDLVTGSELLPGMTISEAERQLILRTLQHTQNNRSQAARLLGISVRTLRNKLNTYRVHPSVQGEKFTGNHSLNELPRAEGGLR